MAQLTAIQIKQTKPGAKPVKLHDGGGLYLLIKPSGGRYWRYDYRYLGRRRTLALGVFPDVSLADARKRHFLAKDKLSDGIDPGEVRKVEKLTRHLVAENSFEAIAREWFNQMMPGKSASYQERTGRILEKDLYPVLGSRPISLISPLVCAAVKARLFAAVVFSSPSHTNLVTT